ncbi:MAG: helicase-related protein [Nannocystales bacterium]
MLPLPIDALQERFASSCRAGARLVVSAPTGSGKSTRLPWWMADALGGPVLVVEPRRVAARALATYGAKIRGEQVGERVGYRVRFDAAESQGTEILFVTPGMALALLGNDGSRKFAGVLVDEFHERGWETDLVTALVQHGRLGPDAALVVCSATLEREALGKALEAEVLNGEGRAFEVTVRFAGNSGPSLDALPERVRSVVDDALAGGSGDVLVFLPGKREIRACLDALGHLRDVDALPLHGGISSREMQAALEPAKRRRVFLSTNVAETSLTIPSVTTVVDSGLERRHVHRQGKVVLAVVPVSLASAEQRRGRAGRVQAGQCVRLWSEAFLLDATTPPQVERISLDDVLLRVGMCGVDPADAASLPWVTSPPAFAMESALERLRAHGAVAADGALTEAGRVQARLPVSWVGARLLTNPPPGYAAALCDLVALMEVGRELFEPNPTQAQSEARLPLLKKATDEVDVAMRVLRSADPRRHGIRARTLSECRRLSQSLRRVVDAKDAPAPPHAELTKWVAAAVPELVFVRRKRADRPKKGDSPGRGGEPWGNGELELFLVPYQVPELEQSPKPPQAGVVLEREWIGSGQRTRGVGRLLMGLPLAELAPLGLGDAQVGAVKVSRGKVVAEVERTLAGVTISSETEVLRGEGLRDGLVQLVLRGSRLKGLARLLLDAVHAWGVLEQAAKRERLNMPPAPQSAATFLREKFATLGVEGLADLELLEHEDILPRLTEMAVEAGFDPREAVSLQQDFPRRLEVHGGKYVSTVDLSTRTVELEPIERTKKEPAAAVLPRFRGFSVVFVKASRRLKLR